MMNKYYLKIPSPLFTLLLPSPAPPPLLLVRHSIDMTDPVTFQQVHTSQQVEIHVSYGMLKQVLSVVFTD